MKTHAFHSLMLGGYLTLAVLPCAALTLTQPASPLTLIAGGDYATETLANPWDMNDALDVATAESGFLINQLFQAGIYSATTSSSDPGFYSIHQGLPGTLNLSRGNEFPVRTADYRFITIKFRVRAEAGPPLSSSQPVQVFFFRKGGTPGDSGSFSQTNFRYVPPEVWNVITFDMHQDVLSGWPAWSSFSEVSGLRIDPTVTSNARIEVDWIRVTRPQWTPQQSVSVQWTDTINGSYSISALDIDGVAYLLASALSGTNAVVSLTHLPPGQYRIRVSRVGATSDSAPVVTINTPPIARMTSPDIRGDQARNFALTERGNAWGPFDPDDILLASQIENLRYDDPLGSGSVAGRPSSGDAGLVLRTAPALIDAQRYRTLCFRLQVFGPRDIGLGSVARVFWGNSLSVMSISDDIVIDEGLNEYCLEDLTVIPLEKGPPTPWTGSMQYLRIDPHEFATAPGCSTSPEVCRDFRLDSLVLAPFHRADPNHVLRWELADGNDSSPSVGIYLDQDRIPFNGNERLLRSRQEAVGAGEWRWSAPSSIAVGTYFIYAATSDGRNSVTNYARGRLLVGNPGGVTNRIFVHDFEP